MNNFEFVYNNNNNNNNNKNNIKSLQHRDDDYLILKSIKMMTRSCYH